MMWLWMYVSWIEDQNQKHKFARDYSVFLGSFSNPQAAKQIAKNSLAIGLPIETIVQITGLTATEIENLTNEELNDD